jgi:hypothetical protein
MGRFVTLTLCVIVVLASFLPWGRIEHGAQFALGDVTVDIAAERRPFTAWHSHVGGEDFRVPNWIVPVATAISGGLVLLRGGGFAALVLSGLALLQTLAFAIDLARRDSTSMGIGLVVSLAALTGIVVAELRHAARSRR